MVHPVSSGPYVAAHRPKHSCPPQSSSPAVHGEGSPGSPWEECAAVAYAEDIGRCRTGPLANSGQKLTSSRQNRRRGNHRRSHRPVLDFPRLLGTANVGGAVGAGPRKDGSPTHRWREMDSNYWSRQGETPLGRHVVSAHGSTSVTSPRQQPASDRRYLQPATISHLAIVLRTFRSFGPGTRSTGISRC